MPRIAREPALDATVKYGAQAPEERRIPYVTPDMRRARLIAVEQMLVAGVPQAVLEATCKEKFGMTRSAVDRYCGLVRERWAKESEQDRAQLKKMAVRRIQQHIRNATAKGQFSAVAQLERLLSDIQGTKEALEVNVNVTSTITEAVISVVSAMTPEEQHALIEEQRRLQLAAEAGGRQIIETEGVEQV